MSLMGLDVGTTGCKTAVFSLDGTLLALEYVEYDYQLPEVGWAQLDSRAIWEKIKFTIKKVLQKTSHDPVTALAVASLGEAVVPVTANRQVLGPSLLNFDVRGQEYLENLAERIDDYHLYNLNGNTLGNHFSLTKLMWIRDHQADLYARADYFLHWSSFIAYMLGADPVLDYSLANRTLLFDLDKKVWSPELANMANFDLRKLPPLVPSGTLIGTVSPGIARELGFLPGVAIICGAHDQCANAVGAGVIHASQAFYGMGSYHCIVPVMEERPETPAMVPRGLNTEHHAVPGKYVSFLYNHGGTLVKWYRNTYASVEHQRALQMGCDIYDQLFAELPNHISSILVIPNFAATGTPEFLADTCGVLFGLHLETSRGDILKGILEGIGFYLQECINLLQETGIIIDNYRAVGGGSKSNSWLQLSADLFGKTITRPVITDAGAMGSAIMAGVGSGIFPDYPSGVQAMVRLDKTFEPDAQQHDRYQTRFEEYHQLYVSMKDSLKTYHRANHLGVN